MLRPRFDYNTRFSSRSINPSGNVTLSPIVTETVPYVKRLARKTRKTLQFFNSFRTRLTDAPHQYCRADLHLHEVGVSCKMADMARSDPLLSNRRIRNSAAATGQAPIQVGFEVTAGLQQFRINTQHCRQRFGQDFAVVSTGIDN